MWNRKLEAVNYCASESTFLNGAGRNKHSTASTFLFTIQVEEITP